MDEFDKNGNLIAHSILRREVTSGGQLVAYDSRDTTQTAIKDLLHIHEYDQANRRIASSTRWADSNSRDQSMLYEETWYDARNHVLNVRSGDGILTTYRYDAFGHKISAQIGAGTLQRWTYGSADYTSELLQNSDLSGGRTTTYGYNEFGQLDTETYSGQAGSRSYTYHDNGLLKQRVDVSAIGTAGSVGGEDYWSTTETTGYEYSALGQRQKESFTRSGSHDVTIYDVERRTNMIESQVLPTHTRTTRTKYDRLGRVSTVHAPAAENTAGGGQLGTLVYRYDELGNRRSIYAIYSRDGNYGTSEKWYTYDREGRMTGETLITPGIDERNDITITYDEVGRRATATHHWNRRSGGIPPGGGEPPAYYDEIVNRYGYDDQGLLTSVRKFTINGQTGVVGPDSNVLSQRYNYRGQVVYQQAWDENSGRLRSITSSGYYTDGRLIDQIVDVYSDGQNRDAKLSSRNNNYLYDTDGRLQTYQHHQGDSTSDYFVNTYAYTYTPLFGGDKESTITVTSTQAGARSSATTNRYDGRGRLIKQLVDTGDGLQRQTFSYDGEGHVLTRQEVRRTGQTTVSGRQDLFFANGQEIASIGAGSLASQTRFSSGYTPISRAYPAATPGNYVVNQGDTLSAIAQTVFGDSALWYLIADANNLNYGPRDVLPVSEEGKTYRLPNVVDNLHNNANTFRPYNPAAIFGDNTPTPSIAQNQCRNQEAMWLANTLVTAIAITLQGVVTAGLVALNVPAPIAGAAGGAVGGFVGSAGHQGVA
ncbi:MAG: hypothetical protein WA793_03990, partial [Sphingorhabdus sp.]|uniref:LysM peptidoglycan-binding domain-containing protein n=1 Tax=Sphingorhabdus sp. TaxID=1902408 RepID=UPI003CBD0D34